MRITDFGVARAVERVTQTQSGEVKGKLGYIAPEQARAKPIDRRADVYALGIVAWETFTGKRLFAGDGPAETLMRVLEMEVPRLDAMRPDVPVALADAIAQALERDIDKRTKTAGELAQAIRMAIPSVGGTPLAKLVRERGGESLLRLEEGIRAQMPSSPSARMSQLPRPSSGDELTTRTPSSISRVVEKSAAPAPTATAPLPATDAPLPATVIAPAPPSSARGLAVALGVVVLLLLGGIAWAATRGPVETAVPLAAAPPPEAPAAPAAPAMPTTPVAVEPPDVAPVVVAPAPVVELAPEPVETTRAEARPSTTRRERPRTTPARPTTGARTDEPCARDRQSSSARTARDGRLRGRARRLSSAPRPRRHGHAHAVHVQMSRQWQSSPARQISPPVQAPPRHTWLRPHVPSMHRVPSGSARSRGQVADEPVHASAPSQGPMAARHVVPPRTKRSLGHVAVEPVQLSATSHPPAVARHTVLAETKPSLGHAAVEPVHDSATSQGPALARHCVPPAVKPSAGHAAAEPVHASATSHGPVAARHVVPPAVRASAGHAPLEPVHCSAGMSTRPRSHGRRWCSVAACPRARRARAATDLGRNHRCPSMRGT